MSSVVRRSRRDDVARTRDVLRAHLDGGRWQLASSTVVVRHNGPLTRDERRAAAVLTAGRGALLAGLTALELAGHEGWTSEEIHVLVPKGSRPPRVRGVNVVIHESRRSPRGRTRRGGLPVCPVPRAAVDAASWSRTDRAACALLASVVRQRLVRPADLRREIDAAPRLRRRALLRGVVEDIAGGAHALSELDFLAFCRRNGFPRPDHQEMRRDRSGRRRYIDAWFTSSSGSRVRVEIDGSIHLLPLTYWDDMMRGNDLVLRRTPALRFPSWAVRGDDPTAIDQLREALAVSALKRPNKRGSEHPDVRTKP